MNKSQWVSRVEAKTLDLVRTLLEKADLRMAEQVLKDFLKKACEESNLTLAAEGVCVLFRIAVEKQNFSEIEIWRKKLEQMLGKHSAETYPSFLFYQAIYARHQNENKKALRLILKWLRLPTLKEEKKWSGYVLLANIALRLNQKKRVRIICQSMIRKIQKRGTISQILGSFYLMLGHLELREGKDQEAEKFYAKAQTAFLVAQNWYAYGYVMLSYARVYQMRQDEEKARWYLEQVEAMVQNQPLALLRTHFEVEKKKLETQKVDLMIDPTRRLVRTRKGKCIHLRKQEVLVDILTALAQARNVSKTPQPISKSELFQKVWKQKYHTRCDGKIYYNINRLRKALEPEQGHPQILLSSKRGYYLAPHLKVRVVHQGMSSGLLQ